MKKKNVFLGFISPYDRDVFSDPFVCTILK